MNWGLRCGQLLAEEGDIRRMNIIERTALWYRLERIGNPYWPYKEESIDTPTPEPEWTKKQWDIVQQLQGQVRFLSSKVNEMRASKKGKPDSAYKGIDIEA